MKKFSAIVIGPDQTGNPPAFKPTAAGNKTDLIEKEKFGSTCVYDRCKSTKANFSNLKIKP